MAVYIVTGKLGGGKSIMSVKRIYDKLAQSRIVATNLDLKLEHLISPFNRTARVIRIPDKPTVFDLEVIGKGTEEYDESHNGLLVLDECGTWFNSRNWNDKTRKPVNDWFLHARKLGWDVILIIQNVEMLDSQARAAIAEHTVFCRRTDRLTIPYLGTLIQMATGYRPKLPKVHSGRVVYGISESDLLVDRWVYRGDSLYAAYDTKQAFLDDYPHGPHSLLPPWHTHGRYMHPRNGRFYMRVTKIMWKRFKAPLALGVGCLLGTSMAVAAIFATNYDPNRPAPAPVYMPYPETSPQLSTNVPDPIIEKLDGARIVGYWTIDDAVNYRVKIASQDPEQQNAEPTILNTKDLEVAGYKITALNKCAAVISKRDQFRDIYCF